jgi:hypothetical protein
MRTTLNLEDELLRAVRSLAKERNESLGAVVSSLLRRTLRPEPELGYEQDVPVFMVKENAPPITPEMVESALENL